VSPAALAGHGAMLAFSALVAGSFALGSRAAEFLSPPVLNAIRFWLAVAIVHGILRARGGVSPGATRAPWRYLILGTLFAGYFVAMFEGLKTAPPVSAAAVFTLTPVLSGLAGYLLLRQVMTPRMALAIGIGAAGALWVIFRADLAALFAFDIGRGEAIYFGGVVLHAIYTPMVRKLSRGEGPLTSTLGTLIAGALVLSLASLPALAGTDFAALPAIVWITILYTAIFATAATTLLLQFAALRLPASKVMAYTYLTPSWVILWELALGEAAPPLLILAGVGLTAAALLLLLRAGPGEG